MELIKFIPMGKSLMNASVLFDQKLPNKETMNQVEESSRGKNQEVVGEDEAYLSLSV